MKYQGEELFPKLIFNMCHRLTGSTDPLAFRGADSEADLERQAIIHRIQPLVEMRRMLCRCY
jgi:hypothetical protein